MDVVDWLLNSDPAVRWQVMRDLTGAPAEVVAAERARVATEGWGARLLARQTPDGKWGEVGYTRYIDSPDGQSLHALILLRDMASIRRARKPAWRWPACAKTSPTTRAINPSSRARPKPASTAAC